MDKSVEICGYSIHDMPMLQDFCYPTQLILMPEVSLDRAPLSGKSVASFVRNSSYFSLFTDHSPPPSLGSSLDYMCLFNGAPCVFLWLCGVSPCNPDIAPRS
jgi:hypothetical protein